MRASAFPLMFVTAAGVAAAVSACSEAPQARVRAITGEVMVRPHDVETSRPAEVGQGLDVGDTVTTGAEGRTTLELAGGNRVELGPNSAMVVGRAGAAAAEVGAVLIEGAAHVSTGGQGVRLSIGTPFGITVIGDSEASLEIDTASGIKVLIGQVSIVGEDGQRKVVDAGNAVDVAGVVVPFGEKPASGESITLEPLTFVLIDNPRQVQVRRAGEDEWKTPRQRDVLAPGDVVRTRSSDTTRVELGENAVITMEPKSEVAVATAGQNASEHRAAYTLRDGAAVVEIHRKQGREAKHDVELSGTQVEIVAGAERARVELHAGAAGRASVAVSLGHVKLADGTVIEAGKSAALEKGAVVGGVQPIARTHIEVTPGSRSDVHYQGGSPPVAFAWNAAEGENSFRFELASKRSFEEPAYVEQLSESRFVVDHLQPGRYFWRVKGSGDWRPTGVLTISRTPARTARLKRRNVVNDNGEQTVIYFQRVLPAIAFEWKPVPGAVGYELRVFADEQFDTPLIDTQAAGTSVSFPSGRLVEGKYYWLVLALDAKGKEVDTGRMNVLTITYDNTVTDLTVHAPLPNQRVTGGSVITRGEVQLGTRLFINGERVPLDAQGRFEHAVDLQPGLNQIAYRTLAADGVERFDVRQVFRH